MVVGYASILILQSLLPLSLEILNMSLSKQIFLAFVFVAAVLLVMATTAFLPHAPAELPPRPTAVSTAVPTVDPPTAVTSPTGGFIQLHLTTTVDTTGLWTAVQWQDADNNWHTVEGWQGTFNPDGMVTWWVAPVDLGKGPFRWQVFEGEGGTQLVVSDAFYLPESTLQTVVVLAEN